MSHDVKSRGAPVEVWEAEEALDNVLAGAEFDDVQYGRRLLRYVVEEALAGRQACVDVSAVARAVFGDPKKGAAANESVVRDESDRMRHALERYYAGAGQNDRVRIAIAKDGYVASFSRGLGDDLVIKNGPDDAARTLQEKPLTFRDMLLPIGVPLAVVAVIILAFVKPIRTWFF